MRETQADRRAEVFLARAGPAELILRIFESCHSTHDLLALATTCQHTYQIWRAHAAPALWRIWLREIPYFQNALVAARMTQVVVDAERRGELPPKGISPAHLNAPEQPTLAELKAAFNLHRLSRALAESFCEIAWHYPDHPPQYWRCEISGKYCLAPPEEPDRLEEWYARISQTVFRLLTVGAALAGTYWEPVLAAEVHPDPEIKAVTSRERRLGTKAFDFLMSFAAYDLEAPLEAQETIFAPPAEWLLADILGDDQGRDAMATRFEQGIGRARICQERDNGWPCPVTTVMGVEDSSHSDAHLVVWELMKMFWVAERLRLGRLGVVREDARLSDLADGSIPSPSRLFSAATEHPAPALAVAVFFGQWRAENVALPTHTPFTGNWDTLDAYPVVSDPVKDYNPVGWLLDRVFLDAGRPNHFPGAGRAYPVPPLEHKFFEYCFRRQLNLCFAEQAFLTGRDDLLHVHCQLFVDTVTLFCHDDVEGRCPGEVIDGDFIDGCALLDAWPPQSERVYKSERQMA